MRSKSHLDRDGGPDRGEGRGEKSIQKQVDRLLLRLQPTPLADERRRAVFKHVQEVVQVQLPDCKIFPVGSFPLKTYLPYSDVDMVMFLPRRSTSMNRSEGKVVAASAWNGRGWSDEPGCDDVETRGAGRETALVAANQALCMAAASTKRGYPGRSPRRHSVATAKPEIRSVSFINARTPIVKMVVGNMVVDLTENQGGSVAAAALLEEADNLIRRDHLFKRSLLLLKAWAWCETPRLVGKRVLGAQEGGLTSYGLSVMVLHLFAVKSSADTLSHPLDVLLRFFEVYSEFDWDRYCLTLDGPVPVDSVCKPFPRGGFQSEIDAGSRIQPLVRKVLAELSPKVDQEQEQEKEQEKKAKEKVKEKEKAGRRGRRSSRHPRSPEGYGEDSPSAHADGETPSVPSPVPHFPRRTCNILDPLNALNNLGHSVLKPNLEALERALQQGREKLECWQLLSAASPSRVSRRNRRQRRPREAEVVRPDRSQGGRSAAGDRGGGRSEAEATSTARAGTQEGAGARKGAGTGADGLRTGSRGHHTESAPPYAASLGQHFNAAQPPHHFAPPAHFVLIPPLHPTHPGPALNGPSQPVLVSGAYPLTTTEGQPVVLAFPQPLLQAVPHQRQHVHQPQPYLVHQGQQGFLRPHSAVLATAPGARAQAEFWPQPQMRRMSFQGNHQPGPDQQRFAGRNMPPTGWSDQGTAHSEMHGVVPEAETRLGSAPRYEEVKGSPIEHGNHGRGLRKSFEDHHDQSMQRSMLPWDLPTFVNASPTSSTASLSDFMEDCSKDGQDCQLQYESGADDDGAPGRPVKDGLVVPNFHDSDHSDAMVDTRHEERGGPDGAGTKRANGNLWTSWFLREFFPECCHRYGSGDGFREDLLDHPCQRSSKLQEPGSPLRRRPNDPDVLQGTSRHAWDSLRVAGDMLREVGPEANGRRLVEVKTDAGTEVEPSTANGGVGGEEDGDGQVDGGGGAWGVRASSTAGAEWRKGHVRRADAVAPSSDSGEISARLNTGSETRGPDVMSHKWVSGGLENGDRPQRRLEERPAADSVRVCVDDETGYTTSEEQGDREDAMPLSSPPSTHDSRGGKSREEEGASLLPVETSSREKSFMVSISTQTLDSTVPERRGLGMGVQGAGPEFVNQGVQCFPAPKNMVSTASQCGGPGRISISTGVQCDVLVLGESRGSQCPSGATQQTSIGVQCSARLEEGETPTAKTAQSVSVRSVTAVRGQGSVIGSPSDDKYKGACDPDEELVRESRRAFGRDASSHSADVQASVGSSVGNGLEDTGGVSRSKKKRKKGKATGVAASSTAPESVAHPWPVVLLLRRTTSVGGGDWKHLFWRGVCLCGILSVLLASVWGTRGRAAEASWQGAGLLRPRIAHEGRKAATQPPVWVMVGGSLTLGDVLASRRSAAKETGAGGLQWYKGGRALPGQTRPFLTISAASFEDEGTYACFALEESGRKGSRALWEETTVRISEAPLVESQLQTQRLARGEMLAIVATASGIPQPEYQWRRNGVPIPGANRPMFVRHSVSEADMGTYTCDVFNVAGSVQWEEMAVVLREEGGKR